MSLQDFQSVLEDSQQNERYLLVPTTTKKNKQQAEQNLNESSNLDDVSH